MPSRWSPWTAGAPSYPARWHFGLFAACWGSHQPLFAGGAGQFLEHIRAEVFPDERILVEQSKAANLSPLRRFGVQAYRPGRRLEQLEELAKRGLCFGGCHGDVTILFLCPSKWDFEYFCKMLYDFILGGLGAVLCSKLLKFGIKFPNPSTFEEGTHESLSPIFFENHDMQINGATKKYTSNTFAFMK